MCITLVCLSNRLGLYFSEYVAHFNVGFGRPFLFFFISDPQMCFELSELIMLGFLTHSHLHRGACFRTVGFLSAVFLLCRRTEKNDSILSCVASEGVVFG